MNKILPVLLGLGWCGLLGAVERVEVLALFPDKAMVSIDGTQRVLSVGQKTPEGVKLLAADSKKAQLEVDGKVDTYTLGQAISTSYRAAATSLAYIWRDPVIGGYSTSGSINGRPVQFLVDTGASVTALSAKEADRLGLDYRQSSRPAQVFTASGQTRGYGVQLERVKVGDIELRGIDAVILEGNMPPKVLLGMTFLSRVQMGHEGEAMVLKYPR